MLRKLVIQMVLRGNKSMMYAHDEIVSSIKEDQDN